ncbi:serine hydrolase [Maritalea sp.]|uniref:serine hydrolase n=1 Tax=Maritalea sp. TaxID=2003361 RepID=UPI003EF84692
MDILSELNGHRRFVTLFVASLSIVLASFFMPSTADAASLRKYAGIVVDAKTGKTLYSSGADAKRYPASVAKVMTLYVLFEELAAGRLKLNSRLKVSKYASGAEPTKLYLKAGSTIAVSDAIKALVTKSANDVARVIAENISGTEGKFAIRMTKTARALGMSRTTYKNASGLPNSKQVTTVRDQARLGMAVFQHFPEYFKYFKTRSFRYRGKTYANHNRLLGSVKGVDGFKTGYIRAAGFNLLTSARAGNRHIIVVGFGFNKSASRNAKVASLVKKYLPKARKGSYWKQAAIAKPRGSNSRASVIAVAVALKGTPPPRPRHLGGGKTPSVPAPIVLAEVPIPVTPAPPQLVPEPIEPVKQQEIVVASIEPALIAPMPPKRPIDLLAGTGAKPLGVIAVNAQAEPAQLLPQRQPLDQASGFQPLNLLGNLINRNKPSTGSAPVPPKGLIPPSDIGDPLTTSSIVRTSALENTPAIWVVQVGAAKNQKKADMLLTKANGQLAILNDYRPSVQSVSRNGQEFYRARFVGFTNSAEATLACDALKEKNISCLALPS